MSGQTFRVGDICIGQYFVIDTQVNGVECVVAGPLEMCETDHPIIGRRIDYFYEVQFINETHTTRVRPFNLRKKHPPQSDDAWAESKVRELTKPVVQPLEVA